MVAVPFWRMRDKYYRILGNRCAKCGAEYFPPANICRKCKSNDLEDHEMPKTGTLLSFTLQRESLFGFEEQEPMIFGLVKLANGVKVVSQIVDIPYESLREGLKLHAVFRRVRDDGDSGQIFYGYKFGPQRGKEVVMAEA
ncbi:MAG: Zn-ribbon domain-containing OB-fold protein [Nitrososphaerales archaeon]